MPDFHAIGIDVGGTKIAGGWVSFPHGTIHARRVVPTAPERGGAAVLDEVVGLVNTLKAEAHQAHIRIDGVGVGVCELVSPAGRILSANCVQWLDQPAAARLSESGPVWLEADVRAAARAEAMLGAGRKFRVFLYVTIGTGIASSLVIHGEPFVGAHGATGTMASTPLRLACARCGHINTNTLDEIASGPGLVHQFNRRHPGSVTTGQAVLAAAANGDPDALQVVHTP